MAFAHTFIMFTKKYNRRHGQLEICASAKLHASWLNKVAWSGWEDGLVNAQFAMVLTGSAEGDVKASLVSYTPGVEAGLSLLSTIQIVNCDDRPVTCIRVFCDEVG